ncbi:MAG: hypothetical protein CMB76_03580 [Euryarchaeota archaeon]|nr:hypothetical protein [Euryarchaeota archaeon]|tara:strand:- start:295 stop:2361 length:2067 start_codon:yes stop_codon:yes gene_type:complete
MLNLKALRQGLGFMGEKSTFQWLAHPKPREGQIEMIESCLESLNKGGTHLASAPTGIGKTAAALAAALEFADSASGSKTVVFLTPKQSQHQIVVDTVRKINERLGPQSAHIKLVDLIGRESMCENVDKLTGRCTCEQNISEISNSSRRDDIKKYILQQPRHVGETIEICKTWGICAWSACRSSVKECDILVCDYNHLFIDEVRNASLSSMKLELEDLVLIVDEAHNLPSRVRMGMQRRLFPEMVRNAESEVQEHLDNLVARNSASTTDSLRKRNWALKVCKQFRRILDKQFDEMSSKLLKSDDEEMLVSSNEVLKWIDEAFDKVEDLAKQSTLIKGNDNFIPSNKIRLEELRKLLESNEVELDEEGNNEQFTHLLAHLIDVIVRFGSSTAICLVYSNDFGKKGRIITHLLDAGLVSGPIFDRVAGSILMSGTLNPPNMYADLLGIRKEIRGESIHKSPFEKFKRPIVVATDVTSKMTSRGYENTLKIQKHIQSIVENTPGNVAVFAPSYKILGEIMNDIYLPKKKIETESRDWSKQDISALLVNLNESKDGSRRSIVLGGVFGGRLSEGVDYAGGLLDTVICIGIQNPRPNLLQKAYGSYIKEKFGQANFWRYANSQPAINTILQAMGRPIRAMGDRALIVLLDKRNIERTYSVCYPPDIRMNQVSDSEGSGRFAKRFFAKVHRDVEI